MLFQTWSQKWHPRSIPRSRRSCDRVIWPFSLSFALKVLSERLWHMITILIIPNHTLIMQNISDFFVRHNEISLKKLSESCDQINVLLILSVACSSDQLKRISEAINRQHKCNLLLFLSKRVWLKLTNETNVESNFVWPWTPQHLKNSSCFHVITIRHGICIF